MKTILTFCLCFFSILTDYKTYFNDGITEYNNKNYRKAIENFTQSYNLKKHSKSSYYISLSYFKLGEDSLAEKFARRAQAENPILAEDPYQINIQHIYEYCELAPRFKTVKVNFKMSTEEMTYREKKEQKEIEKELNKYYSNTPNGRRQLANDYRVIEDRSLVGESQSTFDTTTSTFTSYQTPIVDSL
jgi:tetratricopeptide (TPR) repeat protein